MLSAVPTIYNEIFTCPANGYVVGQSVALPDRLINKALIWQTSFDVTPLSVRIELWGAPNDIDSQYAILDFSDNVSGEYRKIPAYTFQAKNIRFVQVRQAARSTSVNTVTTVNLLGNDSDAALVEVSQTLSSLLSSALTSASNLSAAGVANISALDLLRFIYIEMRLQSELLLDITGNNTRIDLDNIRDDINNTVSKLT